MIYIILIIIIFILLFILFCCLVGINITIFHRDFRFDTFFKKGTPFLDDRFGCWFICGRQGSNKNYFCTYLVDRQSRQLANKIYTNIHSLDIPGFDIHYFTKIDEIIENTEDHCIFIIDEIAKKYNKSSKTDDKFYAWLNQSRKRKRIVILITQEWRELPMWIRRPAKYMFTSKPTILSIFNIYKCIIGDAENLTFNKDEGEYECPTLKIVYYKRIKKFADMYDTFESIDTL